MGQPYDERIMALVHACSHMDAEQRERFLLVECAGDIGLRREVEALLEGGDEKTGFLAVPERLVKGLPSHYRLVRLLGSGGVAEVFLAEDSRLGRRVAIKFLNDTFRRDDSFVRRFDQEARAASALNHPNILTIYDIGEAEGVQYIVSEYVEGETLGTRLARGRLSTRECVEISIRIVSALNAAHQAGIVHRDLKPDNIMLRSDGTVKVLDFGLAKASGGVISGAGRDAVTTSPGMLVGTPAYMSPEQARGTPLDGRSDIFSLGLIMFEMLTGHRPFPAGNTVDIIAAILSKEPRRIEDFVPDSPADLARIIDKTLRKDREERYSSMDDLLSDLEGLRTDLSWPSQQHGARAAPSETGFGRQRRALNWKTKLTIAAAGAIVFAGVLGWFYSVSSGSAGVGAISMRTVPITSWSSISTEAIASASFSPDARMIAFASKKSGATEIWVKPTVGGDPIQVTKNGFENQYPVWSPDGQEIAYFSNRSGDRGIWRISFIGGAETPIVNEVTALARPVRWTNEGKIYFQDGAITPDLFMADAASGSRHKLTDLGSGGILPRTMAVANDGSTYAMAVREDSVWKVKTRRFAGGDFTDIASQRDPVDSIIFHPNGNSVFYAGSIDGALQIFEAKGVKAEPVRISSGAGDFYLQDVSADGSKILFSSVTETSDLWAVNTSDAKESVIANDVAAEYWADMSPDGKSIAYQSVTRPDKPFRGSVFAKSPSGPAVLVAQDGFAPVWSNDGEWIAFFRQSDEGMRVWKVRATGSDAGKVADGGELGYVSTPYLKRGTNHISWAPDSGMIAYSTRTGGISNIWLVRADGTGSGAVTANTNAREAYCCASWTRDGSHLAFVSDVLSAPVSSRLWVAGDDGKGVKVVFESPNQFRFLGFTPDGGGAIIAQKADPSDLSQTPASTSIFAVSMASGAIRTVHSLSSAYFHNIQMSRDGRNIAYVSRSNDMTELWIIPALGGQAKRLLVEKDPKVMFSSLTWSPDGRSIIFGKQTRTNVLSMLSK